MNAVDTNVLLYVHDPRDRRKQQIAGDVVASLEGGILLWQVACEFVSAARKLQGHGFGPADAFEEIAELRRAWAFAFPSPAVWEKAQELSGRFNLSFWDSLVVAAAIAAGARRLYSEDFGAYRQIDGLEVMNPF
jgi:predicted nucleic acid-binding protein